MALVRHGSAKMDIVQLSSAQDFIDILRPSGDRWWDRKRSVRTHVFRGHANANWPLLPAGMRPLNANPSVAHIHGLVEAVMRTCNPNDIRGTAWHYAVAEGITQFIALGRQVGLEVPHGIPHSALTPEGLALAPFAHDLGIQALAQHHGIPTYLLDWSEDPLTAAYFALGEGDEKAEEMAVWAIRTPPTRYDIPELLTRSGQQGRIEISRCSTVGNPYIRAQAGMFMHFADGAEQVFPEALYHKGAWRSFESFEGIDANLTKMTLPRTEAPELRSLLLAEGRSAAHVYPSWDKVSETLRRQWAT